MARFGAKFSHQLFHNIIIIIFVGIFQVLDMATALNTIAILHDIHISDSELTKVTSQFGHHLKRLRRLTSNKYLLGRITALLVKWKELKQADKNLSFPSSPELENFE